MQEYLSLPAGTYTFQAQATDLAGNVESTTATSTNSKSWGPFVLPSPHAIITGVLATGMHTAFHKAVRSRWECGWPYFLTSMVLSTC